MQLYLVTTLPLACSSYTTINDSTRSTSYTNSAGCDNTVFGSSGTWVRFTGVGGTQIPTSPPATNRCGTDATGWYNGFMPNASTTINGTVCYNWSGSTCNWNTAIQVTKCNSFYIYNLINVPICNLRYCTV
ncbi:unnamed protein product [Rotaria socialis]|uniref:UMOD/GP2/OIT3-like D8C domain-containing protein n=1 Tax=Rotaria socialis TaxID=392032 RepID=A0A818J466_9BILA|nr:unnamed protein product [Rotaria socialis]CAF3425989.1 unnamed protein product [Rotaria socialis]CAF3533040.1 unnamed protein product [Rotaria socialis]CAF3544223.1 unnamed protein product [Rotaria socialis]CAF3578771.1 unnamed protein product [Rotaria socialis]